MTSTASKTSPPADSTWASAAHRRTVYLVLTVVGVAMIFDGYDLVIYGAVLSSLLEDPSHIGQLSPAIAGTLGSYALIGVMIGALTAGALGDRLGRRKVMLIAIAWFSICMALTALATSITMFGFLRFLTGLGVGMIIATGGAIIAEFAPKNRRNLFNAIVYSGVPAGGVLASLFSLALEDLIGWRGLFLIGATPILFLLPLAWFALPESPRWLVSRGRKADALAVCARHGLPEKQFIVSADATSAEAGAPKLNATQRDLQKTGFAGIFSRTYLRGTLLISLMSFIGLLSTYGLNTWLPKIMQANGASSHDSLYSLLALNGGAVIGGLIAARYADKIGAKTVITSTFFLAALSLALLPMLDSLTPMYPLIALAGIGVLGTQVLTYGLTANFFGTATRAAGMAWASGFGRLGGILGPMIGGLIIGAGFGPTVSFWMFAGAALVGAGAASLIPRSPAEIELIESSEPASRRIQEPALNAP